MKLRPALTVLGLTTLLSTPALAADHFYDAMALAIDHFNAEHEANRESCGSEHKFMCELLNAVAALVPQHADVTLLGRVSSDRRDPFRTLSKESFRRADSTDAERAAAEALVRR